MGRWRCLSLGLGSQGAMRFQIHSHGEMYRIGERKGGRRGRRHVRHGGDRGTCVWWVSVKATRCQGGWLRFCGAESFFFVWTCAGEEGAAPSFFVRELLGPLPFSGVCPGQLSSQWVLASRVHKSMGISTGG